MGYMIGQSLQNCLIQAGIKRQVTALVTQVLVNENDPDFAEPTKFIGQFYRRDVAEKLASEMGWQKVRQFPGDSRWRRVVASPQPLEIIEKATIKSLVEQDFIVIAAGGGGIPVISKGGRLNGVDAVIDKDRAAAVMARDIEAELLIILTDIEKVAINFRKSDERQLDNVTLAEISRYYQEGQFPPGSMGPKIEAAMSFLKCGGKKVIITSIEKAFEAVTGASGTTIVA
jgi:carbamate kinase